MAQTGKQRKDKYNAGQLKLDRKPRPIVATPAEFEEIKKLLAELRAKP